MCVEMEGAAIGHTCCVNDIPFVIRTMSDNADEEAAESATNFEENRCPLCRHRHADAEQRTLRRKIR